MDDAVYRVVRHVMWSIMVSLAYSSLAMAQWMGKQTGCYPDAIVANPNRPTVANPADITQYGVLELEYGWDTAWPQGMANQNSFGGLLKFGLLCDVEVRWNTTSFLSQADASGTHSGVGDNWIGPQVRLYEQTRRVPTLSFSYAIKLPSASQKNGLGTFLIGRENLNGFDRNYQLNLAFSHPLHGRLQFTGEFYGDTRLDRTTPGFISSLWALTYTVTPRLVFDGGFEAGLTSGGPHRHVFVGATYSIGELYPGWQKRRGIHH